MSDASGNGLSGAVGRDVKVLAGSYRFAAVAPDAPPVRPDHTAVVSHDDRLNPRGATYTVDLRIRTRAKGGNVVQKGQSQTAGGFWKVELNDGEPTCVFRGPDGTSAVRARGRAIADGAWHTLRCRRSSAAVELWVDGVSVGRNTNWTGRIANDHPLSIGGKQRCNQVKVGCDYFGGDLDYVRLSAS